MFEATFSIYCKNSNIGNITFEGRIGTPESEVSINVLNKYISLHRKRKSEKRGLDAYRPYTIEKNGVEVGEVFQATKKIGIFKSYGYQYANFDAAEFKMYPIGFGEQGARNPIFFEDIQVALLLKPAVIVDDMHNFEVIVRSDNDVEIAVVFVAYIYAKAFFKPGEFVKKVK